MKGKVTTAIVLGVLSAVIAYYGTLPVPEELPDHGKMRMFTAAKDTVSKLIIATVIVVISITSECYMPAYMVQIGIKMFVFLLQ